MSTLPILCEEHVDRPEEVKAMKRDFQAEVIGPLGERSDDTYAYIVKDSKSIFTIEVPITEDLPNGSTIKVKRADRVPYTSNIYRVHDIEVLDGPPSPP